MENDEPANEGNELDEATSPSELDLSTYRLPDDPAARAEAAEQILSQAQRVASEKRELERDVKRKEERIGELDQSNKTWFKRVESLEQQLGQPARNGGTEDSEQPKGGLKADIGEYLDANAESGDGAVRLAKDIKTSLKLASVDEVERLIEKKAREMMDGNAKEASKLQKVIDRYSDIGVPGSKLKVAADRQMEMLDEDERKLSIPAQWELAAGRAAAEIGWTKPNGKPKDDPAVDRERLRRGQGGDPGRSRAGGAAVVSDDLRKAAKYYGPDVTDDMLKRAAKSPLLQEQA